MISVNPAWPEDILVKWRAYRFVNAYRTFFQDFSMSHASKQVAIEYVVTTVTGLVYTGEVDERGAKFRLKLEP